MKTKRNLLITIATIIGSLGIVACGNTVSTSVPEISQTGTSSSDSGISTSITYAMPVISRDAPKEIAVGEEIDLDQYVTVNANGGYELSVVTGDVTINGHKITANALGLIEVKVQSGTYKKIFETKAVSAEKILYGRIIDTLASNYTCKVFADNTYMGYAEHTDYGWIADYTAADPSGKPEGLALLSNDKWYSFNYNAETGEVNFPPQSPVANGDLYFLSMPFTLNSSNFVDACDGNGEVIFDKAGNTTVTTDPEIDLHYNRNDGSGTYAALVLSGLSFSNADFNTFVVSLDSNEDGNVLVFDGVIRVVNNDNSVSFRTGLHSYRFEISKIGSTSIPGVESYIAAGTIPQPLDMSDLANKFVAINEAKNMTVTSNSNWYNSNGDIIDAPTVEGGSVEDYGFWQYNSVARFTESGVSYINDGANNPGVYEIGKNPEAVDSPWYVYSKNGEEEGTTTEITNTEFDIWNISGMPQINEARIGNLNVENVSDHPSGYYVGYDKNTPYDPIELAYAINFGDEESQNLYVATTSNGSYTYEVVLGAICTPADLRYNMNAIMGTNYKYFDFSNLFIFENGDFGFELSIRWSSDIYFCVFSRFSDFGTTELPENFMGNADFVSNDLVD